MATLSTVPVLPGEPGIDGAVLTSYPDVSGFEGGASLATVPGFGLTATLQNQSGVGHSVAKLAAGSAFGFFDYALSSYAEDWADGAGGQATRYLVGPWSEFNAWRLYMMGYTVNVPDLGGQLDAGGNYTRGK